MIRFLGIGPGRCGTNSLTKILEACRNVEVYHEDFISRWYDDAPHPKLVERFVSSPAAVVGQVALQMLPKVKWLRDRWPDLRIICLHRPKDQVVRSHLDVIAPMFRACDKGKNHWADNYPTLDAASHRQSVEFWWELYERSMLRMADPVMHIKTEDLGSDATCRSIFDFLGIHEDDRVLVDHRKYGVSGYPISGDKTERQEIDHNPAAWLENRRVRLRDMVGRGLLPEQVLRASQ